MVMRLKLWSAASRTKACTSAGSITASVATNPSMVAMFGRIMPAPLAMPVTVTVRPPMVTWRDAALGNVSVVMMPSAACPQFDGFRSASAAGRPAMMRSIGSVSMITPVENGSTSWRSTPSCVASASHTAFARARPSAPVPALALPVFTTIARAPRPAARCSRQICTGAAQKRLRVNTPATVEPGASLNTVTSRRLALRTPAIAVPISTPATRCRSSGFGATRFTGITVPSKEASGVWRDLRPPPAAAADPALPVRRGRPLEGVRRQPQRGWVTSTGHGSV
jgi:hypothetical protein